jgi:hypothetical protein
MPGDGSARWHHKTKASGTCQRGNPLIDDGAVGEKAFAVRKQVDSQALSARSPEIAGFRKNGHPRFGANRRLSP